MPTPEKSVKKPQLVRKRLVLNFPGFEKTSPGHQIERLSAGGQKTASLWGFELESYTAEEFPEDYKTVCSFKATAREWETQTRYVHFSWSDIIKAYEEVRYPRSLFKFLPSYLMFFLDGSVGRYAKASSRYWGFSIYPFLLLVAFSIVGIGIGVFLTSLAGVSPWWASFPAFFTVLVLGWFIGQRTAMNLSIADWAFARDLCKSRNPNVQARHETFAEELIREIQQCEADEILIVGHSFGSVWAVIALSIALEKQAQLLDGKRVTFIAMGSSLLKIGLVKSAKFLHAAVRKVLRVQNLLWYEVQTRSDWISFYKSHPFEPMDIRDYEADLVVHRVNFKNALSHRRLSKMKNSMYLAHRQYILYADKRVHHDYQLRVFGPFFADQLAHNRALALQSPLMPKKA